MVVGSVTAVAAFVMEWQEMKDIFFLLSNTICYSYIPVQVVRGGEDPLSDHNQSAV
jgi:hypothetical protein